MEQMRLRLVLVDSYRTLNAVTEFDDRQETSRPRIAAIRRGGLRHAMNETFCYTTRAGTA
jgi:hypothetical protein